MTTKKHQQFIKTNPFQFELSPNGFSELEIARIEKLGCWFKALLSGELSPITDKQKEFICEMNSREEPKMPDVKLWKKYLRREIEEKDDRGVLKSPPPKIDDHPFYSREGAKALRKGMFRTITETHRK